ncbi:MAG: 50S ribosomal protein L27 [Candidatus Shapirobacteria bacterium]
MAHTKSQGKTNQKSNRAGQRRGVKVYGGQKIKVGEIIIRQVGSSFRAGEGVKTGKDFTLYAIRPGVVKFLKKLGKRFVCVVKAPKVIKTIKVEKVAKKVVKTPKAVTKK